MTADQIAEVLRSFKYVFSGEKELQDGVAEAFLTRGIAFDREKSLGSHGVVDFMIGRIAIEVKIKGSPSDVARQLLQYCASPDVDAIILFTGRSRLGRLPTELLGKPVTVVTMWSTFL